MQKGVFASSEMLGKKSECSEQESNDWSSDDRFEGSKMTGSM